MKRFNKRWMIREFERKSVKSDSEPGQRQTATHHAGDSFVLLSNGYDVLIEKGSSFTILESILIQLHNFKGIIKKIVV